MIFDLCRFFKYIADRSWKILQDPWSSSCYNSFIQTDNVRRVSSNLVQASKQCNPFLRVSYIQHYTGFPSFSSDYRQVRLSGINCYRDWVYPNARKGFRCPGRPSNRTLRFAEKIALGHSCLAQEAGFRSFRHPVYSMHSLALKVFQPTTQAPEFLLVGMQNPVVVEGLELSNQLPNLHPRC